MLRLCPDRPLPPYSCVPGRMPHPISHPAVPLYRMEFATIGDIPEIQVTRFKAVTIDVKVIDEQNQPVADAAPTIEIESPNDSLGSSPMRFMKQPDGRWGCTHLIPNVASTVSVEAAGLQSDKQVMTLKEGEQRELTFQMKKAQSLPKDQQQE